MKCMHALFFKKSYSTDVKDAIFQYHASIYVPLFNYLRQLLRRHFKLIYLQVSLIIIQWDFYQATKYYFDKEINFRSNFQDKSSEITRFDVQDNNISGKQYIDGADIGARETIYIYAWIQWEFLIGKWVQPHVILSGSSIFHLQIKVHRPSTPPPPLKFVV